MCMSTDDKIAPIALKDPLQFLTDKEDTRPLVDFYVARTRPPGIDFETFTHTFLSAHPDIAFKKGALSAVASREHV